MSLVYKEKSWQHAKGCKNLKQNTWSYTLSKLATKCQNYLKHLGVLKINNQTNYTTQHQQYCLIRLHD